jgi:hypothetical protein
LLHLGLIYPSGSLPFDPTARGLQYFQWITDCMITIRRSNEARLETIEKPVTGCWIEVTNPNPEEAANLARDLNVPQEFVTLSLDPDEIPIIEKANGAFLTLARIPHFQGRAAAVPYVTLPMGFIVTDEKVVTICRHEHDFFAASSPGTPDRFVYRQAGPLHPPFTLECLEQLSSAPE